MAEGRITQTNVSNPTALFVASERNHRHSLHKEKLNSNLIPNAPSFGNQEVPPESNSTVEHVLLILMTHRFSIAEILRKLEITSTSVAFCYLIRE